jgi:hypothetical protein
MQFLCQCMLVWMYTQFKLYIKYIFIYFAGSFLFFLHEGFQKTDDNEV